MISQIGWFMKLTITNVGPGRCLYLGILDGLFLKNISNFVSSDFHGY